MEIKNNSVSNIQVGNLDSKSYNANLSSEQDILKSIKVENKTTILDIGSEEKSSNKKDIEQSVNKINSTFEENGLSLSYSKDEKTGKMIVQLLDTNTKEVIKQIPTKEMLAIADNIGKYLDSYSKKGSIDKLPVELLINQKA